MSEISGALFDNDTTSHLVKDGPGKVFGILVNSHTSGTLKLADGTSGNDETSDKATGVFTISGAVAVADYAKNVLTSVGTVIEDGARIGIGTITYIAKTTLTGAANEVLIGGVADGSAFLANLKKAINASGVAGTDYGVGTVANPDVIADTLTVTKLTVYARVIGTAGNSIAVTEDSITTSWDNATFTGGVATNASTISIGGRAYTGVLRLAETIGLTAVPDQVLWATSNAVFLDNLKSAINLTSGEGTVYGTGTTANTLVSATTNTDTAQTVEALQGGTDGNSITTTETMANAAWGAATLSGGLAATITIMNTYTFPSGPQVLNFPAPINFQTGLYVVVGGTIDYTIIYR